MHSLKVFFQSVIFNLNLEKGIELRTSRLVVVNTNYCLVQGLLTVSLFGNIFYSFHGIPYAKPPLGELRFKVRTTFISSEDVE